MIVMDSFFVILICMSLKLFPEKNSSGLVFEKAYIVKISPGPLSINCQDINKLNRNLGVMPDGQQEDQDLRT